MPDVAARRLGAHRLTGVPFASAVEAVGALGAVQSQDFAGARWALAQRLPETTDGELGRLYDSGAILRTHVLRPTWHLVLREDIRWMLALTAPRIRRGLVARYRELGLDAAIAARAAEAFGAALAGGLALTRAELAEVLRRRGISPDGQRLAHLLMSAELDGLIVSGPRRGAQVTWALLDDRAPRVIGWEGGDAVAELARRYFRSHGPAQLIDFVWWSGLTVSQGRQGLTVAADSLAVEVIAGSEHWFDPDRGPALSARGAAHLLPNFDEYTVAYRDRSAVHDRDRPLDPALLSYRSVLSNVLTIAGVARGAWRRTISGDRVDVEIRVSTPLRQAESAAVEREALRLGRFLERPVTIDWVVLPPPV